ncbi:Pif1 helicase, partial [Thalictrum thalictroides]
VGTIPDESLKLPADVYKCYHLNDLLSSVYPELNVPGVATPSFLKDRTILAPQNDDVREINNAALHLFPGEYVEYLGADQAIETEGDLPHTVPTYSTDILNALDPSSLPPFRLRLKVGSPIMLLRNIARRDGLCNGTRLIVEHCATRVIEARILTGYKAGETVFIPRITLPPSSAELPIPMSRCQFPVRLALL